MQDFVAFQAVAKKIGSLSFRLFFFLDVWWELTHQFIPRIMLRAHVGLTSK